MTAPLLVLAAFGAVVAAPVGVLLLAPLLFGVPHVAGDVRVLWGGAELSSGRWWALGGCLAAMTAVRLVGMSVGHTWPAVELTLGALAVGVAVRTQAWALAGLCGFTALAWWSPAPVALAIGHLHNVVAVAAWAWLAPRSARVVPTVVIVGAGTVALLSGAADGLADWSPWAGLSLAGLTATLAPDLPGAWGPRLVLSFAFLQAVHYLVWTFWLPAADGGGLGWSGWSRSLGAPLAGALLVGALALPALGWFDPAGVRSAYLSVVLFHGWLELAVFARRGGFV